MKQVVVFVFCFITLCGVLAEHTGETNKRHEFFCGEIAITYQALFKTNPSEIHPPTDGILHRYCPTFFIIDFSKHTQNLTVSAYGPNEPHSHSLFLNPNYGERFLMKKASDPNDPGMNITLFPEIIDMSHEDSLKYRMFPVMITRREKLSEIHNKTYLEASLGKFAQIDEEKVNLSPGWLEKLEGKQMLTQTMIPGPKSTLKEKEVTIMRGWLNVSKTEGIHATIKHEHNFEYITIFFKKPNLESLNPGYVDVILRKKNQNGEPKQESARLVPGWLGELSSITKQTLVFTHPEMHSKLEALNVTVYPGAHIVQPENGILATFNSGFTLDVITIYYYPEHGKPEDNLENRRGMYEIVDIIKQVNQTFRDEKAALSPGWIGVLKKSTEQTILSYADNYTPFVGQNATVTVGWQQFANNNSGFTALYRYGNVQYPISVHFKATHTKN